MLITEAYRAANEHLHETTDYGVTAPRYRDHIVRLAETYKVRSVLDYGSGRNCWVERMLPGITASYDPAVPSLATLPEPADLLVSCDVMEHIEPDCLDDVLDHMATLARVAAFITISTRPAKKFLPDGRNAHLIQKGPEFWLPKVMERWVLAVAHNMKSEIMIIAEARKHA